MAFLQSKQKALSKSRHNKIFSQAAATVIKQFIENPEKTVINKPKEIPPGSPIG